MVGSITKLAHLFNQPIHARVRLHEVLKEPRRTVFFIAAVRGFSDAIGIEQQMCARFKVERVLGVGGGSKPQRQPWFYVEESVVAVDQQRAQVPGAGDGHFT